MPKPDTLETLFQKNAMNVLMTLKSYAFNVIICLCLGTYDPQRQAILLVAGNKQGEHVLRSLRQQCNLTQSNLSEMMGMDQSAISRLESRQDFLLSTLNAYVQA